MNRFFSVFPNGAAGVGLFALRLSLVPALLAPAVDGLSVRLCLGTAGVLLLLGLLTRMAAIGLCLLALGATMWTLWNGGLPIFGTLQAQWVMGTVSLSLALVGPGAYSIDARRFGWQELRVPAT